MQKPLKLLSAACALALTACAAQQPVPYSPPPRPVIDPLPPDLHLTDKERNLCRTLLQRFSATEQLLQESCGSSTASSSASKPAAL